jgi:hypothetical protein
MVTTSSTFHVTAEILVNRHEIMRKSELFLMNHTENTQTPLKAKLPAAK